ncbi:MAG: hypothetical protein ABIS47_08650 [Acidimicrobiales bacterium]
MGDKITIAEARARRTDPAWRRRHRLADLRGAGLVLLLLVGPSLGAALWEPLRLASGLALLVVLPAALWLGGPVVGLERRTAVLVAIPVLNLMVLVPAAWRLAHLGIQRWQGPLEPPWGDGVWLGTAALGVACWLFFAALLLLPLT